MPSYNHIRKIKCKDVAGHIETQLDAPLTSASERKIRQHLQRCPNCTAYLDSMKKTVLLYRNLPSPHPSRNAEKKLFAVLQLRMKKTLSKNSRHKHSVGN
ncbi:MAG: zf-HC2 domain-containing protein [Ignavibacteriales bacterium]|nr:zf-HC2 domain-containing protein [Ignavibacteriales bacterium]